MIKVAIVDDEQIICDKIKNILLKFDKKMCIRDSNDANHDVYF